MKKDLLRPVRVEEMERTRIEKDLREGRIKRLPEGWVIYKTVTVEDSRVEVLNRVARIACYACDTEKVAQIWQKLLETEERVCSFRYCQKEKGDVNPCRVVACVHHMLEKGLYTGEACNLRVLCKAMYPDGDWESMRRNNTDKLTKEDMKIIDSLRGTM